MVGVAYDAGPAADHEHRGRGEHRRDDERQRPGRGVERLRRRRAA